MQKPSIGRIVLVKVRPGDNNGGDTAPAIITRVNSDVSVNVRVMLDAASTPAWMTSLHLCETEEEAVTKGWSCYWPPRV